MSTNSDLEWECESNTVICLRFVGQSIHQNLLLTWTPYRHITSHHIIYTNKISTLLTF